MITEERLKLFLSSINESWKIFKKYASNTIVDWEAFLNEASKHFESKEDDMHLRVFCRKLDLALIELMNSEITEE